MNEIETAIRLRLQNLAQIVKDSLPKGSFFVILAGERGPNSILQYVANARREDIMQLMQEFLATSTDRDWARDLAPGATENEQEFAEWLKTQEARWAFKAAEATQAGLSLRVMLFDCWNASRARQ